jgi:hypothetical protein
MTDKYKKEAACQTSALDLQAMQENGAELKKVLNAYGSGGMEGVERFEAEKLGCPLTPAKPNEPEVKQH